MNDTTKPIANGNRFEQYVSDTLEDLVEKDKKAEKQRGRLRGWLLTNILLLLGCAGWLLLWYAKVNAHITDANIHATYQMREEEFNNWYLTRTEQLKQTVDQQADNIDKMQKTIDDLKQLQFRVLRQQENFDHTGRGR